MTAAVSAAWHWFVLYQRNNGKTVHWSTDSPSNLSPKAVTSWQSLSYRIREKVMICFHLFDSGFHKLLGAAEHQNKWRHWYISVSILTDIFGSNVHNCENVLKYCVCVCVQQHFSGPVLSRSVSWGSRRLQSNICECDGFFFIISYKLFGV